MFEQRVSYRRDAAFAACRFNRHQFGVLNKIRGEQGKRLMFFITGSLWFICINRSIIAQLRLVYSHKKQGLHPLSRPCEVGLTASKAATCLFRFSNTISEQCNHMLIPKMPIICARLQSVRNGNVVFTARSQASEFYLSIVFIRNLTKYRI
jgi:hypothetical protein